MFAAIVLALAFALLPASHGVAAAEPSPSVPSLAGASLAAQGHDLVAPASPATQAKMHKDAKVLATADKKVIEKGMTVLAGRITCYVSTTNAFLSGPGVEVDVFIYCLDDYGVPTPVYAIGVTLTIFQAGVPVKVGGGVGYFTPGIAGGVVTDYCLPGAYYYGEAYVEVVFPNGYVPPYRDGAFGSLVSIPVC